MILDGRLKNLLNIYFKEVRIENSSSIYDFTARSRIGNNRVYICCKQNLENLGSLFYKLKDLLHSQHQECAILISEIDNKYKFAVAAYTHYGRCYSKQTIDFKELNNDNIDRLNYLLNANEKQLKLLPIPYFRLIKCIFLNDPELIEGTIVYLRKFRDGYKMQSQNNLNDQERLHRLLKGTPENEFPSDEFDKMILNLVRLQYPQSEVKSKTMLFDFDLFNNVDYLNKKKEIISCEIQDLTANASYSKIFDLELYFYPNFFTNNIIKKPNKILQWSNQLMSLEDIYMTYEPLSSMNF